MRILFTPAIAPISRRRLAGFSLIELMVVVAIIAILAAIAYPSYDRYVVNTRRAVASACLLERAQFMERIYTTRLSYLAADGSAPELAQCPDVTDFYELSFAAGITGMSYTLRATPLGAQLAKDSGCGTLTLNQQGARGVSGSRGVAACW